MSYNANILRERVTVQAFTTATDEYGQQTEVWSDVATVWAAVLPQGGRERMKAEQVSPVERVLVVMRYRPDVTPQERIVHRGRVLEVHSVSDARSGRTWLEIDCTVAA
jgi:SPP1 family predicted phage head-tail adaptor